MTSLNRFYSFNGIPISLDGYPIGGYVAPEPAGITLLSEWAFNVDFSDSVSSYDLTILGEPEPVITAFPAASGYYGSFYIGELGQDAHTSAIECPNIFTPIRADDPWNVSFWYCNPTPSPTELSGIFAIGFEDIVDIWSDAESVFISLSGGAVILEIGTTPDAETWYLITLAFDGTNMKTYYDATLVDTTAFSYSGFTEDAQQFIFGLGALIPAVECVISDARFYTGAALSQSEITALYNGGPSGPPA